MTKDELRKMLDGQAQPTAPAPHRPPPKPLHRPGVFRPEMVILGCRKAVLTRHDWRPI